MKPLVSILVNNYNYGRFLAEAIDSVLNQTYPHIEIIVIDDGSTDESRQIIKSYGNKIIPILKENGGQASAFNASFSKSNGEIIVFLDSDDYLFPEAIEQVITAWKPGISKLQFRLQTVDVHKKPIGFYPGLDSEMENGDVLPILLTKGRYTTPVTSGNAFSRDVLQQILPMPESEFRICADAYLVNLVPFYGEIISLNHPLGAYRIHGKNFWSTNQIEIESLKRSVLHDLQKYQLITNKAKELEYQVPSELGFQDYTHLRPRLASLRLNPQEHPILTDKSLILSLYGIRSIFLYTDFNISKKIVLSLWFIWVGLLPLPLAKVGIERLNPKTGIRPLNWLQKKDSYKTIIQN